MHINPGLIFNIVLAVVMCFLVFLVGLATVDKIAEVEAAHEREWKDDEQRRRLAPMRVPSLIQPQENPHKHEWHEGGEGCREGYAC